MAPPGLSAWGRAQRALQPHEAWLTFKDWVDRDNPRFAFNVARGLVAASAIPETERGWAALVRREARARMAFPAPERGLPLSQQNPLRDRILCLCAHGGLTGVPQVSIPGAEVDGLPVGLSIVAGHGEDASLVAVARALEDAR